MSDLLKSQVTRRSFLKVGAVIAAAPALNPRPSVWAQATGRNPTKVLDFQTFADLAKTEQEGELVYYGHDSETAISTLLDAFKKDFPKIKTSYVRLQTGALYAKLTSERSANRFLVDVVQFSEVSPANDLQKKGGYEQYVSPETAKHKPEYLSNPAGYFAWGGVTFAGIAYNKGRLKAEQAPRHGRTSSTRPTRTSSAPSSPPPEPSTPSGTCFASFTAMISGRSLPS